MSTLYPDQNRKMRLLVSALALNRLETIFVSVSPAFQSLKSTNTFSPQEQTSLQEGLLCLKDDGLIHEHLPNAISTHPNFLCSACVSNLF